MNKNFVHYSIVEQTCCIVGHKIEDLPENIEDIERIKQQLSCAIDSAIANGVRIFLNGGCTGIDIMSCEILREKRIKQYLEPRIVIITIVPFKSQSTDYPLEWKARYKRALAYSNDIVYMHRNCCSSAYRDRNRFMADSSNLVIAVFDGRPGETKDTIDYAKKMKRKVILIPTTKEQKKKLISLQSKHLFLTVYPPCTGWF